jgi:hypothetical protein
MRNQFTLTLISLLALIGCADRTSGPRLALDPSHFTLDTPIEQLAADRSAAAVIRKDIPGLLEDKSYPVFKSMSLRLVGALSKGELSSQTLSQTEADLWAISPANLTTALK